MTRPALPTELPPGTDPALEPLLRVLMELPHFRELGLVVEQVGRGEATLRCDYQPRLVGNPATGTLHGGVISALLDSVCGLVAFTAQTEQKAVATLDLRIDYMKPAASGAPVYGWAEVYHMTRSIAFVRGRAYQHGHEDVVATCVGTMMIGSVGFRVAADSAGGAEAPA